MILPLRRLNDGSHDEGAAERVAEKNAKIAGPKHRGTLLGLNASPNLKAGSVSRPPMSKALHPYARGHEGDRRLSGSVEEQQCSLLRSSHTQCCAQATHNRRKPRNIPFYNLAQAFLH